MRWITAASACLPASTAGAVAADMVTDYRLAFLISRTGILLPQPKFEPGGGENKTRLDFRALDCFADYNIVGILQRCLSVSIWLDSLDRIAGNAIDRDAKERVIAIGESCERQIPGSGP